MKHISLSGNTLVVVRTVVLTAALSVCSTWVARGQVGAMVVDDPRHIQTTIGEGIQRAEEWKSSYGNSLETLQSIQNMLKEAGVQTDLLTNNQIIKSLDKAAPHIAAYTDYAREMLRATQLAEQAINQTYRLVSQKGLSYNDALYIIKADADQLTRLMKTYKLNKNIYAILRDDTINNTDKLNRIREAKAEADVTSRFFQMQIGRLDKIEQQKALYEGMISALGTADRMNPKTGKEHDSWNRVTRNGTTGLAGDVPMRASYLYDDDGNYNYNYGVNTYFYRTKDQWDSTVGGILEDSKMTDANAATADLSKAKKNILRLVELIIMILAMGYTVIGFIRITKAEAQSKDVLLKIALGILFSAIVIAVLESTITGKITII